MGETTPKAQLIFEDDYSALFKWPEYMVFVAVLVASMGIGVFYGFFNKKNRTNDEFLMAGRQMSVFPVTLSLICSFISAITLLGNPVEVYFYGIVYIYFAISFVPMTLAVSYLYLPVFFSLQLTSAYEYFEKRFNRQTRLVLSVSGIIHLISLFFCLWFSVQMLYMPLTVWGPSLALDQVAGINKYWSSAAIFLVCIAYSSIGGLKAVLWSDALQAVIMFGTMITVIIVGIKEVGGISVIWERAEASGRTEMLNFDTDLRTRHTFWTGLIAAYFSWIPLFAGTQAQIQRYLSVPTMRQARLCLWLNMVGLIIVIFLCSLTGLLIFAKYYDCDPVSLDGMVVSSSDQLLPLFVMDVLGGFPGLPGLLVAGLTSGSLSSVSSALNALPAIIIEDFVKPYKPDLPDAKLAFLSKVISAVGGLLSFSLIFVISQMGNILTFASLLHGTFAGPIVGFFSLGMFFPWTNALGCVLGLIPSLGLTLFYSVGSILANNAKKLPDQKLPLRTDGCYINSTGVSDVNVSSWLVRSSVDWKDKEYDGLTNLLSISYLWQPVIPIVGTVIFGLLFSVIINMFRKSPLVKKSHMTPVILSMWIKLLGEERLRAWIDFEDDPIENISEEKVKSEAYPMGSIPRATLKGKPRYAYDNLAASMASGVNLDENQNSDRKEFY